MLLIPKVFVFAFCLCPAVLSFTITNPSLNRWTLLPRKGAQPIFFKTIDNDEDPSDAALLKTQARTPPGFNVSRQAPNSLGGGVNQRLILALILNQLLIVGLATAAGAVALFVRTGSLEFLTNLNSILDWSGKGSVALFDFWPTPERIVFGVLGAIPLLAFSTLVERSDKTIFANINFSTITMCLTLFGRRKAPPPEQLPPSLRTLPFNETKSVVAFMAAVLLSGLTGFCEESVFRRMVPSVIEQFFSVSVPVAFGSQALLFALGHVQPGSKSKGENQVLIALQLLNGIGFGLLYLLTDLPTCMICHAVYDTYEFYNTWASANAQIEYADQKYKEDFDVATMRKTKAMLAELGAKAEPQLLNRLKRLFFTFDTDRNLTLSRSEVRRGLAYMAVEQARPPPPEQVIDQAFELVDEDQNERVDFAEFVNLYFRSGGGKMISMA